MNYARVMKCTIALILAGMTSSSIATLGAGTSVPAPILGVDRTAEGLQFHVISTGCTRAEQFRLETESLASGQVQVTLVREQQDKCRRMPLRFTITMELDDPTAPVLITNPLVRLKGRASQ